MIKLLLSSILLLTPLLMAQPTKGGLFDATPSTAPYTIVGQTVYITTEIGEPTQYDGLVQMLDNCKGNLHFIITSPGGVVDSMYEISNAMSSSACHIDVTVRGMAASAAAVIAISGDTLTLEDGATLMFHNIQIGGGGPANQLVYRVQIAEAVYKSIIEKKGQPLLTQQEIDSLFTGQEIWITKLNFETRPHATHRT